MAAIPPTGASVDGNTAATMNRLSVNGAVATGTGNLRLTAFTARRSFVSFQVRVVTGSTAAAATPTLCRVGLYSLAANGDGTLIASVANSTAMFSVANSTYVLNWSIPVALVAGDRYAVGIIVVTGAAAPTICGSNQAAVGTIDGIGLESRTNPWVAGLLTAQTDLPASFTLAALVNNLNAQFASLT